MTVIGHRVSLGGDENVLKLIVMNILRTADLIPTHRKTYEDKLLKEGGGGNMMA